MAGEIKSDWDQCIEEAERLIAEVKAEMRPLEMRLAQLKRAAHLFNSLKKEGVAWPVTPLSEISEELARKSGC